MSPLQYSRIKIKKYLSKPFWAMLSEGGIQLWLYSCFCKWTKVWALTDRPVTKINRTHIE